MLSYAPRCTVKPYFVFIFLNLAYATKSREKWSKYGTKIFSNTKYIKKTIFTKLIERSKNLVFKMKPNFSDQIS